MDFSLFILCVFLHRKYITCAVDFVEAEAQEATQVTHLVILGEQQLHEICQLFLCAHLFKEVFISPMDEQIGTENNIGFWILRKWKTKTLLPNGHQNPNNLHLRKHCDLL